jgi:hypothetical protein
MTPSGLIAAWPRSLPALFACVCLSFATPLPRAFGQEVGNPFLDTGTAGKLGGGRSPGPQGPGDTVGPGAGGTGGTGGSGGTAPAPGTGSGSSDGAGPAGGPQGLPVGGAGPGPVQGAPATGGGTPPPTTGGAQSPFDWTRWFDLEREELLFELGGAATRETGSYGFFLGQGNEETSPRSDPGGPIGQQIVPFLLELSPQDLSLDVEIEWILALGRIWSAATPEQQERIAARLLAALKHKQRGHAEVATLALGATGSERFVVALTQILADSPEGRSLVALRRVPERQRAFAATSLGLIGRASAREDVRRYCVHQLALWTEGGEAIPDVMASALLGLAAIPLERIPSLDPAGVAEAPSQSRTAQLRLILERFDRRAPAQALWFAPGAVARLLADLPEAARETFLATTWPAFEATFVRSRRASPWDRAGAAVALGQIARLGSGEFDRELRDLLLEFAGDADDAVKQLAFLSLGRVAARPGLTPEGGLDLEGLEPILDVLMARAQRGASTLRSAALIGLGLARRGLDRRGLAAPESIDKLLYDALDRGSDPLLASAAVMAAGLAAQPEMGERLAQTYAALPAQGGLRARAAYGVALHQGLRGRALLREELSRGVNEAAVVTGLARALLLMGDPEVLSDAQRDFAAGASIPRRLGWIDALGLAGGRPAVPVLLGWAAADGSQPSVVRARAVRALGLLCAPGAGDWARSLARVLNPLAPLVTFSDPFQGGILDLAP